MRWCCFFNCYNYVLNVGNILCYTSCLYIQSYFIAYYNSFFSFVNLLLSVYIDCLLFLKYINYLSFSPTFIYNQLILFSMSYSFVYFYFISFCSISFNCLICDNYLSQISCYDCFSCYFVYCNYFYTYCKLLYVYCNLFVCVDNC